MFDCEFILASFHQITSAFQYCYSTTYTPSKNQKVCRLLIPVGRPGSFNKPINAPIHLEEKVI